MAQNRRSGNRSTNRKPNSKGNRDFNRKNAKDKDAVKDYPRGSKSVVPIDTGSVNNDSSWYIPSAQMAKDVASFPMGISNGLPIQMGSSSNAYYVPIPQVNPTKQTYFNENVPGILVYNIMPTIGNATNSVDPINLAGANLYTTLQINSSRNPEYEQSDITMLIVAMSDLYSLYNWMTRIYGILSYYSDEDRYTPKALIEAMGLNFEDFYSNIADFRTSINQFAYSLTSLYFPKGIDYVNRKIFMYESIYKDSNTSKAQYYMFNPVGFFRWSEAETQTGLTQVVVNPLAKPSGKLKVADVVKYAQDQLTAIMASEDVRMMCADLKKAFGDAGRYQVAPISETYAITPAYSAEVLSQMENAFILPKPTSFKNLVLQATGINQGYIKTSLELTYTPNQDDAIHAFMSYCEGIHCNGFTDPFRDVIPINFHSESVGPEDILVASRLSHPPKTVVTTESHGGVKIWHWSVEPNATELVLGVDMYQFTTLNTDGASTALRLEKQPIQTALVYSSTLGAHEDPTDQFSVPATFKKMTTYSKFDWTPRVYPISTVADTPGTFVVNGAMFDYDYYTLLSLEELERMNYNSMLGLFEVNLGEAIGFKK